MEQENIDVRIPTLIKNCAITGHRSLFVIVGEKGADNVPILYRMISKDKPEKSVLWCKQSNTLQFPKNQNDSQVLMETESAEGKQQGKVSDLVQKFLKAGDASLVPTILGQTFAMVVIQDFEAITPSMLVQFIETVDGGGIVVLLFQNLRSFKQLYNLPMHIHTVYKTKAFQDIVCRFNERFTLSLSSCRDCLIVDDNLNILPVSANALNIKPLPQSMGREKSLEEKKLKELIAGTDPKEPLLEVVTLCNTFDQCKAVLRLINSLSEKAFRTTVTLTSARGRGKSAALGLAVAAAIKLGYTSIIVVAPETENIQVLFKFLLEGLIALGYKETSDYKVIRCKEHGSISHLVVKKHTRQQTVMYFHPTCIETFHGADLLVIDRAAAIPLPFIQNMLGPYTVFMASTITGYEGTGCSVSFNLINQLRKLTSIRDKSDPTTRKNSTGRVLHEITLNEPIRYRRGDQVEDWLNKLLCLDVALPAPKLTEFPEPSNCKLYYVNKDTLFSYNKFTEKFLRKLVAIMDASQYMITPDNLIVLADAPAHHIFCLCAPSSKQLPEILCVLQVCLEGKLSESSVRKEIISKMQKSKDIRPCLISRKPTEKILHSLSGARIVQIATHPEYQRKGYGSHAMKLLQEFFEGGFITDGADTLSMIPVVMKNANPEPFPNLLEERLVPRTDLPPLLCELNKVRPEVCDYLAVLYGVNLGALRFFKRAGFCPAYLAHKCDLRPGEYTCLMLKPLNCHSVTPAWLKRLWLDFCDNMMHSLILNNFSSEVAVELISYQSMPAVYGGLTKRRVLWSLNSDYIAMLRRMCSGNSVLQAPSDVEQLALLFFTHHFPAFPLEKNERIVLFAVGILKHLYPEVCRQLNMNEEQVAAILQRAFFKVAQVVLNIIEE